MSVQMLGLLKLQMAELALEDGLLLAVDVLDVPPLLRPRLEDLEADVAPQSAIVPVLVGVPASGQFEGPWTQLALETIVLRQFVLVPLDTVGEGLVAGGTRGGLVVGVNWHLGRVIGSLRIIIGIIGWRGNKAI